MELCNGVVPFSHISPDQNLIKLLGKMSPRLWGKRLLPSQERRQIEVIYSSILDQAKTAQAKGTGTVQTTGAINAQVKRKRAVTFQDQSPSTSREGGTSSSQEQVVASQEQGNSAFKEEVASVSEERGANAAQEQATKASQEQGSIALQEEVAVSSQDRETVSSQEESASCPQGRDATSSEEQSAETSSLDSGNPLSIFQ